MLRKSMIIGLISILLVCFVTNLAMARALSFGMATRFSFISIMGQSATATSFHGLVRFDPLRNLGLRLGVGMLSGQGVTVFPIDLAALYLFRPFYVGGGIGLISAQGIGITTLQGLAGLEFRLGGPLSLFGEAGILMVSVMGFSVMVPSVCAGVSVSF